MNSSPRPWMSVGEDGVITVEEGTTTGTELEITEGLQFDKGYISPYFVTDAESMEAELRRRRTSCCTRARSPRSRICCRCSRRSCSRASHW